MRRCNQTKDQLSGGPRCLSRYFGRIYYVYMFTEKWDGVGRSVTIIGNFFAFSLSVHYARSVIGSYASVTAVHFLTMRDYQEYDQFCLGVWRSVVSNHAVEAAVSRSPRAQQVLVMPLLQLLFALYPSFLFPMIATCPVSALSVVAFNYLMNLFRDIHKFWSLYAWPSAMISNFSLFSIKVVILQRNRLSLNVNQSSIRYLAIRLLLKNLIARFTQRKLKRRGAEKRLCLSL